MPRLVAASISITSTELPARTSTHDSHTPQGSGVGLSALHRAAAIQGHGQNAGNGGFADAPVPAEDITMRNPLLIDGILEGTGHVFLPNHLRKTLRPVLAR